MLHRLRRLRKNSIMREMISETRLSRDMFIYPYFVARGNGKVVPVQAMPGINRFTPDKLMNDVENGLRSGVNKLLLFGTGDEKSDDGNSSHAQDSVIPETLRMLRKNFGDELLLITDVCLCAYTTHGHCGIIKNGIVDNDSSVDMIAKMALAHAQAGADLVAPSDMMDGRVIAIRELMDNNGFTNTGIMSYSTKFASAYYGPFREAADSAPGKGDRKTYQMDIRNGREALREALADEKEGADLLMVKPALAYLDIIKTVRENSLLPIACYNVSGEYSMIKAAAAAGYLNEQQIVMENMIAFARAGADVIISYHTRDIFEKKWLA